MEVHYLAIVLAKSFIAAGDKEEILLLVKVIAKAKKASPDNAGLSCRAICRYVGRRKIAVGRVFTILTTTTNITTTILRPRTTRISQYQKGDTRKVKPIWIYWSKR